MPGQLNAPEVLERLADAGIPRDQFVSDQRDAASRDFSERFNVIVPGSGVQPKSGEDRMNHTMAIEEWQHAQQVGWESATVINMLPWKIEVRLAQLGYFYVPAPKENEVYERFVIHKPVMDKRDMGDGRFASRLVMPTEIAREFERQYQNEGGVFFFRGTETPETMGQLVEAGKARMTAFMEKKYMEGQSNWARFNKNPRMIDDTNKKAAKYLFAIGHIEELPEWVYMTKGDASTMQCPKCNEVIRKGATVCKHCHSQIGEQAQAAATAVDMQALAESIKSQLLKEFDLVPKGAKGYEQIIAEPDPPTPSGGRKGNR